MMNQVFALLFAICVLFLGLVSADGANDVDNHESCQYWASTDECTKNPGYMLENCRKSCRAVGAIRDEPAPYASFYDIVETDIDGNEFKFDIFRGKVVYIINVASYCGYTEENYKMFRELKKYQDEGFVMVLAPCNAFGYQEPGDGVAIKSFAGKQGFSGIILSKADVNGQTTRPAFRYLKHATSTYQIKWYVRLSCASFCSMPTI